MKGISSNGNERENTAPGIRLTDCEMFGRQFDGPEITVFPLSRKPARVPRGRAAGLAPSNVGRTAGDKQDKPDEKNPARRDQKRSPEPADT